MKRTSIVILLFLLLMFPKLVLAADIYKTVKQSGGDYTTMDDCLDGNAQDLTSVGNLYCQASGTWSVDDTETISMPAGYTTDSTHRIILTALDDGARHNGTAGTTNYRNYVTGFSQNGMQGGSTKYVTVEYLVFGSNGSGGGSGVNPPSWPNSQGWIVRNNIIYGYDGGYGIKIDGAGNGDEYRNNIIYDCFTGIYAADNLTQSVYNNTVYSNDDYGIKIFNGGGGGTVFRNNLSIGNTTADYDAFSDSTHSNNASGDTSGDIDNYVDTTQFVDAGGRNLHLKSGADSIDAGYDLSGSFTDDIDGDTRSVPFDIGADEFQAAALPSVLQGITLQGATIH